MDKEKRLALTIGILAILLISFVWYLYSHKSGLFGRRGSVNETSNLQSGALHGSLLSEREAAKGRESNLRKFILDQGRSPSSLLAAFQLANDESYLRAAAKEFPKDPSIIVAVLCNDLFPEERSKWLNRFLEVDPENALPYYLLGQDLLSNGDIDSGLAQISKTMQLEDISHHGVPTGEAIRLYLSDYSEASQSELRHLLVSSSRMLPPYMEKLQQLNFSLKALLKEGSPKRNSEIAALGYSLGLRMSSKGDPAEVAIGLGLEGEYLPLIDDSWLSMTKEEAKAQMLTEARDVRAMAGRGAEFAMNATIAELMIFNELVFSKGELRAITILTEDPEA